VKLLPWERRDDEPDDAWVAYQLFRDSCPRNLKNLVGHDRLNLNVTLRHLYRWSSEFEWRKRNLAFDRELDAEKRAHQMALLKETVDEVTARHIAFLQEGDEWAIGEMTKYRREAQSSGTSKAKVADVIAYMKLSIDKGRLIKGETTERTEHVTSIWDKLSPEELAQWNKRRRELEALGEDAEEEELPPAKQRRVGE
jgi:hypothetical protein